jgi:hypothetical protein
MTKKKAIFNTSWFKLEKYEGLKQLDAKGWYAQIQARRALNNKIKSNKQLHNSFFIVGYECQMWLAGQQHQADLKKDKQAILQSAITAYGEDAQIHTNNLSWDRLNEIYQELSLEQLNGTQAGETISRMRKGVDYNGISATEVQAALLINEVKRLTKNPIVVGNNSWWDQPLKELPHEYDGAAVCSYDDETYPITTSSWDEIKLVAINTTATDMQIRNDFDRWLKGFRQASPLPTSKARRKGRANKKPLDETDFREWIDYKVIPYLDLTLIAEAEGKKIKRTSGNAETSIDTLIFTKSEYSSETISKEVVPRAKSLLADKTFHQLYLQLLNR